MSLQITSTLKTPQGFEVSNAYGRIAVQNGFTGDNVQAAVAIYISEAAFLAGDQQLQFLDLTLGATAPYVYEPNTENILDIAHDLMIATLADQEIVAVKMLS